MNSLRVALVQTDPVVGAPHENLAAACSLIKAASDEGADLVCFPEASLTGYSSAPDAAAIESDDAAITQLIETADALGVGLGFGYLESSAGKRFITYRLHDQQSDLLYRKTHLGQKEQLCFEAGDALPVAEIADCRIGVHLCSESHIPEIASTLRGKGAEALLIPFASGLGGERRLESWNRFLPARALDNGAFVLAVNSLMKTTDDRSVGGGIAAYNPSGELIASCVEKGEQMVMVTIGGNLPREGSQEGMHNISYFDRRKPQLYQ